MLRDGAYVGTRPMREVDRAQLQSAILNIASTHSFTIIPHTFPYPVAKHALLGLTRQLKLQLNVENLANKKYIGLSHTDNNLTPGNPRTVRAALRATSIRIS